MADLCPCCTPDSAGNHSPLCPLAAARPAFERAAHGALMLDGREVAHTLQCPHCGAHFVSVAGSGARRTFCLRCMAVTCGRPECDACVPLERKLEAMEGTRPWPIP